MKLILKEWRQFVNEVKARDSFTELVGDPRAFFTMSNVDRLGVYPLSGYNTPTGVYSYPLDVEHFMKLHPKGARLTGAHTYRGEGYLPFRGEAPLIHVFLADWHRVLNFNNYNKGDLEKDLKILNDIYGGGEVKSSLSNTIETNTLYRDARWLIDTERLVNTRFKSRIPKKLGDLPIKQLLWLGGDEEARAWVKTDGEQGNLEIWTTSLRRRAWDSALGKAFESVYSLGLIDWLAVNHREMLYVLLEVFSLDPESGLGPFQGPSWHVQQRIKRWAEAPDSLKKIIDIQAKSPSIDTLKWFANSYDWKNLEKQIRLAHQEGIFVPTSRYEAQPPSDYDRKSGGRLTSWENLERDQMWSWLKGLTDNAVQRKFTSFAYEYLQIANILAESHLEGLKNLFSEWSKHPDWERTVRGKHFDKIDMDFAEESLRRSPYSGKNIPGAMLYATTYRLKTGPKNWARILSSDLKYDGIIDPGRGIIHKNEPTQAVFFPQAKRLSMVKVITLKNANEKGDLYKNYKSNLKRSAKKTHQIWSAEHQAYVDAYPTHRSPTRSDVEKQIADLGKEPLYSIMDVSIPQEIKDAHKEMEANRPTPDSEIPF